MARPRERFQRENQERGGDEWEMRLALKDVRRKLESYFPQDKLVEKEEWAHQPEFPTEAEIGWLKNGEPITDKPDIPDAKINERYSSKEDYLSTQYRLMRIDGTLPLARSVDDFRQNPTTTDPRQHYRVYEEVFFTGLIVTHAGLALKIEFSATAIGKIVDWRKSKRLRSGSLLALTPASDAFKTKCVPVIVASRTLEGLQVYCPKKPSIWVFIGDPSQIDLDPQQKWVMVECIQGFWEAYRHPLQALQKIRTESFPMADHLINLKTNIDAPEYRTQFPIMDLSALMKGDNNPPVLVDVLAEDRWEEIQDEGEEYRALSETLPQLDDSQMQALRQILSKKLAIVQGPPGTGKTFTSVAAIKVLLDNRNDDDPPIIIAAQTNHAIDQILRHVATLTEDFVRIGGYTTDEDIIRPRTLGNLKPSKPQFSHLSKLADGMRKSIATELEGLLEPLCSSEPIPVEVFHAASLLSNAQKDTISNLTSQWSAEEGLDKMSLWCDSGLTPINNIDQANPMMGQDEEDEEDLDEEEMEAENRDSDKFETLHGSKFEMFPGYKDHGSPTINDEKIERLLSKHEDMNKIPMEYRSSIYQYLCRRLTKQIASKVQKLAQKCKDAARHAKIGRWENDYRILCSAKVIGLTTTGLSKYRGLLHTLDPKIVLIEEAAETLEPYTAAAVFDTLEHLILLGDHQQLRANICTLDLKGSPVNFDISLFERLVKNNVEFAKLTVQRRMRPEIRSLIKYIYPDLTDHPSVLELKNIDGLGEGNLLFFHHEYQESMDENMSKKNDYEARMIVEFAKYLVWNDVKLEKITVLTFYNGQKKLILNLFRKHGLFDTYRIKVCTVDSYQGEENDVILLSLVRNNAHENIGFLTSINRACVAMSRARRGLFIFGNAKHMAEHEGWTGIMEGLIKKDVVSPALPLYCPVHDVITYAKEPADLQPLHGGCDNDCNGLLPCGHYCPLKCHPARPCQIDDCEEGCEEPACVSSTLAPLDVTNLRAALTAIVS